jgi:hypothetical protein
VSISGSCRSSIEVDFHLLLEVGDLFLAHRFVADPLQGGGVERVAVDRDEVALDLDLHGRAGREEEVRRARVGHQLEERSHEHGVPLDVYFRALCRRRHVRTRH